MGGRSSRARSRAPIGTAIAVMAALALALGMGQGRKRGDAGDAPAPASPVSGNAENGKRLYVAHGCYACHGYGGETGVRVLVGNPRHLATEQDFVLFLRARADVAPRHRSRSMPNYAVSTLSDTQAKDIYARIRTFTSTAPELRDIPALTAAVAAAAKQADLGRRADP
jgi:mono/diheme cytochrome c family protein